MPREITIDAVGLTLDLLLWRAYGQAGNTDAMLEEAYQLNSELMTGGPLPVLPLKAVVVLPDLRPAAVSVVRPVDLFT